MLNKHIHNSKTYYKKLKCPPSNECIFTFTLEKYEIHFYNGYDLAKKYETLIDDTIWKKLENAILNY